MEKDKNKGKEMGIETEIGNCKGFKQTLLTP